MPSRISTDSGRSSSTVQRFGLGAGGQVSLDGRPPMLGRPRSVNSSFDRRGGGSSSVQSSFDLQSGYLSDNRNDPSGFHQRMMMNGGRGGYGR